MRVLLVIAIIITISPAFAQQYLPEPDLATCQARSAAQCQALGCDSTGTVYWWICQPLTDGAAAVRVETDRPDFGAVHPRGPGLTAPEQSALVVRTAMSTKLPDILSNAAFKARFPAGKKAAIVSYLSAHPGVAQTVWNRIVAGGDVDLQDATVQQAIAFLRAGGVLNDADVSAALAPQPLP